MDLFARTCNTERMNAERIIARAFVLIGGLIWTLMLVASSTAQKYTNLTYSFTEVMDAGISALLPLGVTVIVFALALFYERLAAAALALGSIGVVIWGISAAWETVIWGYVMFVIVAPMVVAAVLFLLAARTQQVCELEEAAAV